MAVVDDNGVAVFRQWIAPADDADDPDARVRVKPERVGDLDCMGVQFDHPPEFFFRCCMRDCNGSGKRAHGIEDLARLLLPDIAL